MAQKKLRILYVITKSNMGGAQRYVLELATGLPKEFFDVAVALGGDGLLKEELEHAHIATYPIRNFGRDINLIKDVLALFELIHTVRKWKPDVIHLNSSKAGGAGALIARILGVRHIVFTVHGWPFNEHRPWLWRAFVWFFSWITALLSHTVILVSDYDRKSARMPFVSHKFTVIKIALPTYELSERTLVRQSLFTEYERQSHIHDLWLVTTAELTPNKNILYAIQAVARFNASHAKKIYYTIMGDGELKTMLDTYVREHALEHQVKLLGYMRNARTHLRGFDTFLLPSRKEGLPYAILEAGYAGLPVIASAVGGIPEVMRDGSEGILVDPNDSTTVVNALERIMNNEEQAEILAVALQHRVLNEFSLKQMIDATQTRYTKKHTFIRFCSSQLNQKLPE